MKGRKRIKIKISDVEDEGESTGLMEKFDKIDHDYKRSSQPVSLGKIDEFT